jgi:putative FmdB family regulatory protein
MPTYEYRCPKGHEFEAFQRITSEPVAECPVCGEKAERLLSAGTGLIFKGSGFYITDYKKQSGGEKGESKTSDSESKPKDSGSSSSKSGE